MYSKEDILDEIRRTAIENGGTPLGISRFESETGIKNTDWGRYWARFSDAQSEAGVKANTFSIQAFPDEYIFEKFIFLTRELGKIPVTGELIVKRNTDSTFPAISVFQRRFSKSGSKKNFLIELIDYSRIEQHKDIIQLCELELEKVSNNKQKDSEPNKNQTVGYVYLGKSGKDYKIGMSFHMDRRREDITLTLAERFEIIHRIQTDDPKGVEQYWHKRFETKRKRGEWFALNSSDIKAFKRWKRIF